MKKRKVRITNTGYLPNSPDRHNPMNIIPSNQITMDTVPFPILGIDNLGNQQMMMPGMNYTFPGQYVTEIPMGKYQKGGSNFKTKLSAKDEEKFKKFFKTLPDNLRADDSMYDIRGYWDASGRPEEFDYSQPTQEDGYYHAFSRHPETGKILKAPTHPTFNYAVDKTPLGDDTYVPVIGIDGNVYMRDLNWDSQRAFEEDTYKQGGIYMGDYEFKDGGAYLDPYDYGGKVVSQIWKEKTGLPWSAARKMGLSDGSYDRNIELRKELIRGEHDNLNKNPKSIKQPRQVSSTKQVIKSTPQVTQQVTPQVSRKPQSVSKPLSTKYGVYDWSQNLPKKDEVDKGQQVFDQAFSLSKKQNLPEPKQEEYKYPTFAEFQKQKLHNTLIAVQPVSKSRALPTENKRQNLSEKDQAYYDLLNNVDLNYEKPVAESTGLPFKNVESLDSLDKKENLKRLLLYNDIAESQKTTLKPGNFEAPDQSEGFSLPSISETLRGIFLPLPLRNIDISMSDIEDFKESATKKLEEYGILEPSTAGNLIKFEDPLATNQKLVQDTAKVKNYYIPPTQLAEDNNADYGEEDNKFWSFRYQNSNDEGLVYIPTPRKAKLNKNSKFSNVKGVAHFLIQKDPVDNWMTTGPGSTKEQLNRDLNNPNKYVPFSRKEGKNKLRIKYAKGKEEQAAFQKQGFEPFTPLRTIKLSDIAWDKVAHPRSNGFSSGIYNVLTKDGKDTFLIFKKNTGKGGKLGQSNGSGLVFIIETPNGRVIRDFTGTVEEIENESKRITEQFNVPEENVTLGFYDAGSYTAKPVANKNNEIYYKQYSGFNVSDLNSGAALMIPSDLEQGGQIVPQFKNGGMTNNNAGIYLGKYEFKDGGLVKYQKKGQVTCPEGYYSLNGKCYLKYPFIDLQDYSPMTSSPDFDESKLTESQRDMIQRSKAAIDYWTKLGYVQDPQYNDERYFGHRGIKDWFNNFTAPSKYGEGNGPLLHIEEGVEPDPNNPNIYYAPSFDTSHIFGKNENFEQDPNLPKLKIDITDQGFPTDIVYKDGTEDFKRGYNVIKFIHPDLYNNKTALTKASEEKHWCPECVQEISERNPSEGYYIIRGKQHSGQGELRHWTTDDKGTRSEKYMGSVLNEDWMSPEEFEKFSQPNADATYNVQFDPSKTIYKTPEAAYKVLEDRWRKSAEQKAVERRKAEYEKIQKQKKQGGIYLGEYEFRNGGLVKMENGGPKEKGWREYKTPTGESLYLDPRFKDQRYYVNEKGDHVTPDQNISLYDVTDNVWESGTSLPTLEVSPKYKYVQRPGSLGSMETTRIDLDNGSQEVTSPDVMATKREMDAFANATINPAGLLVTGVGNIAQGNIGQGLTEVALSHPLVANTVGRVIGAPFKFAGKQVAQTYGPALSEVGQYLTTQTPLKNVWKFNPPVEVPKPTSSFKSEIDWGKWNSEIPSNKALMDEYHIIEQTSKANGTWMKNADGTPFDGTPEEFVYVNSSNFKKNFPNGAETIYKGVGAQGRITKMRSTDEEHVLPFFAGDKNIGKQFTSKYHTDKSPYISHNNTKFNPEANAEVHKFYYPKDVDPIVIDANKGHWGGFKLPENAISGDEKYQLLKEALKGNANTASLQQYVKDNNLSYITIKNLIEKGNSTLGTVYIINPKMGRFAKSAIGNNGMIDMSNPNIYKGLIPYIGAGYIGEKLYENQQEPVYKKGGIYLGKYMFKDGGLVKYQGNKRSSQVNFDEIMMRGLRPNIAAQDNTYVTTPIIEQAKSDDAKGVTTKQRLEKEKFKKKMQNEAVQKKKQQLIAENKKLKEEENERVNSWFGTPNVNHDDYIKTGDGSVRLATTEEKEWRNKMLDQHFEERAKYLVDKKNQPISKDLEDFADIAGPALAFELAPYALPYVIGAGKSAIGTVKNLKFPRSNKLPNNITLADDLAGTSKWTTKNAVSEGLPNPPKEEFPLYSTQDEYIDLTKYSDDQIDNMIQEAYYNPPSDITPGIDIPEVMPSGVINLSKSGKLFKQSKKTQLKKSIIDLLDPKTKYPSFTSEQKQAYQDLMEDFNAKRLALGESLADNIDDVTYRIWGNQIYRNLGDIVSPQEIRDAHKFAINYFKNHPFVDKKDMGLLMRERLADKIVDFKLPQFVDRSGEPILSVHPFTEIQAKNTTQASTIGEALRRKFTRSSMDAKSMDKVEKIIKSSKTNVGDLDLKKLNRTLTDKGYTPEERNLINAYARGFDSSMNEVLRANHDLATLPENTVNKFYLDKAEQLKQALLKNKINSEEIPYVFRGVTDHNVELVDPKTLQPTGKIIRKTELQKGDMFLDRGFASTTYHPHRKGWGTFEASEKIIIPPGLKLSGASPNSLGHSYFPHEKEIILPSGLIRRVDDVIEKVSAADGERFVTSVVNPYKKGGLVKYQGLTGSSQVREDKTALPTLNVEANRPGFWERLRSSNYNPYNWGLPDYSELKSPTEALYKAAYYGEPEFMWRGHRTNIDDVWGAIPMEDRLLNTGKLNWEDDISFFDDSKHPQVPFYDRHHNNLITLPVENVKQYQKEYTDALNYTKEWLNSPMYNKMLKESTSGDSPKYLYNIESGRRWNLENASPVVNITDKTWSINGTDTPAAGWSSENGISIVNDEDNLPLSELEVKIKNPGLYNKDFYFPEERDLIAFQLKQEKDKRTKDWLRTLFTHEFSHHTDKHGTASRLIPRKDVEYILNNKLSNKESKKLLNTLNDSYTRYSEDPKAWNAFYRDYVGEPTEVRARLQEIRQYARNNGIYDPFTQEIDDKTLQKLIDNNRSVPGLWDLINVYKPEQIKYMLNHISENKTDNQGVMSNNIQYGKKGGLVKAQEGKEMPFGLPLKEQNIYLLPEYNQPRNPMTGEILPDPQRPNLGMGTGATEYKYTYGSDQGDIDVPSVVAGQYIGDQALDRYMLTGERFKTMADPGSYSKFYNETGRLGLMQEKKGGSVRKVKIKRAPRKNQ